MTSSSSSDIWAKLITLNPNKEDIPFKSQSEESNRFKSNMGWEIYQKSTGETLITNRSGNSIKIDDDLVEIGEEREIYSGQKIAFNTKDKNFDYVFFLVGQKPKNQLKRPREESSEPPSSISKSETKKLTRMNTDLQQEGTCSICYSILQKCAALNPCLHTFCSGCLISHFKNSIQCPLCRKEATSVTKNPVLEKFVEIISKNSSEEQRPKGTQLEGNVMRNGEGTYVGNRQNGVKEGKGTLIYANGDLFDGVWKNNKKEGSGVFELKDGGKYEGPFRNDLYNGLGKFTWTNGDEYEGNFIEGKKQGFGIFKYSNGGLYTGKWRNDKREGAGVFELKDVGKYEGPFCDDLYNGLGIFSSANGDVYEGNFIDGKKNGFGTFSYVNGGFYTGNWKTDERTGDGVLFSKDGDVYEGSWLNDCFHGKGKFTWKEGHEYEGNWIKDKREGYGKMKYSNGRIYEGYWKDDKREGNGILTLSYQDKHDGIWANDFLQSVRKVSYANGNIYEGGVRVSDFKKHGKGVMIYKNGDKYDGLWENDKKNGRGKEITGNGKNIFEGIWKEGVKVGEIVKGDELKKRAQAELKEKEVQKQEKKEPSGSKHKFISDINVLVTLYGFKGSKKKVKVTK